MEDLLNKLFHSQPASVKPLNYRVNRFCNYLVLNLSKNCRYLEEIGVQIVGSHIILTVRADVSNKPLFESDYRDLLQSDFFKDELLLLESDGIDLEIEVVQKAFSETFIKNLSRYYFIPKKTRNRYLFKYCSYNKNLFALLINNSLWFSDPNSFNDPFDCRYSIDADPSDNEIIRFYYARDNVHKTTLVNYTKEFQMPSKEQFLKDLEEHHFINSFSKKQGICCFTEKYNDKLMWAHYAENVAGICLVFDSKITAAERYHDFSGSKVRYRNSLVRKFYDASPYLEVTDVLYSKNKVWKYEREIRERIIFEKGRTDRSVPFDPRSLTGIIFGAKMQERDKETIKNLISQLKKYDIELIDSYIDLKTNSIRLRNNRLKLK